MNRPLTIIANWKMHKIRHQAKEFIQSLNNLVPCDHLDILIAAPFTALETCHKFKKANIIIGAQNVSEHSFGAYTGEISAEMLADLQTQFCLLGHSERRLYFHETAEQIGKKISRCLEWNIRPILCIGETLEQRNTQKTDEVLFSQILASLQHLTANQVAKITLAYEPVWAIGSGMAATEQMVQDVHAGCRGFIEKHWGRSISCQLSILYGGSVNAQTLPHIISQKDVDGVLVGGASLDASMFANIIKISRELKS